MSRLAALDMGSNSFHLLVADSRPRGRIKRVKTRKEMIRLGEPVSRTGKLGSEAKKRALKAFGELIAEADSQGAERFIAVGTEALRIAEDGAELLQMITEKYGVQTQLLTGLDEAALSLHGMTSALNLNVNEEVLGLDLGGGSFEIALGTTDGMATGVSLPLGGAKLIDHVSDPPRLCEQTQLYRHVTELVMPAVEQITAARTEPEKPFHAIGTAGTIRDFGRLGLILSGGIVPSRVRGMVVTLDQIERAYARICSLDAHDRMDLDGISAKRADLLPSAGVALIAVMESFGLETVTLCDWGLREGVLLDIVGSQAVVNPELVIER